MTRFPSRHLYEADQPLAGGWSRVCRYHVRRRPLLYRTFKAASVLPVVDMISEVNEPLHVEPSNGSASSELAR